MTEPALHRLISAIYAAALEPERPTTIPKQAAALTGSSAATLDTSPPASRSVRPG